jgi:hypothetical protein
MALIICVDCKKEFSTDAKLCPHCGAKKPKKPNNFIRWLIIIFVIIFIFNLIISKAGTTQTQQTFTQQSVSKPTEEINPTWFYNSSIDTISNKPIWTASIESVNYLNLNFPYSGPQKATLEVRHHPQYGKDVIFRIERGQILCHTYENCSVVVRFDNEPIEEYSALPSKDNSSNLLFIKNYSEFVQKALKAQKVFIEVPFFQNGNQTFEFDIAGLHINKAS